MSAYTYLIFSCIIWQVVNNFSTIWCLLGGFRGWSRSRNWSKHCILCNRPCILEFRLLFIPSLWEHPLLYHLLCCIIWCQNACIINALHHTIQILEFRENNRWCYKNGRHLTHCWKTWIFYSYMLNWCKDLIIWGELWEMGDVIYWIDIFIDPSFIFIYFFWYKNNKKKNIFFFL